MADIRIKDLATTASSAASDDFMALDGATNGTRKMSAANPSVTTLTTSGVIAPGGSVHGANGAVGNPSFAFLSDQNTGLYRIGTNNIGVAANGAKVLDIATTGLTVTGALGASSLTSPAATNLTLAGGAGNQNIVLQPSGNGSVEVRSGSAGNWALVGTIPADGTGASVYSAIPAGANTASNPNWYVGHRFSAHGNFAIWPYNGSGHVANYLTIAASTGNVTIASTTAGASNAGALVVAGGISAGAASYIGGALTVTGALSGSSTISASNTITGSASSAPAFTVANNNVTAISFKSASSTIGLGVNASDVLGFAFGGVYPSAYQFYVVGGVGLAINAGGAATFAGAVTVGGNVGFYNASPVAKPTGVAVTAAAIHAALVTLNLIAA